MPTIVLTSGTTWTVPEDWNSANNTIVAIGAGGNGGLGFANGSGGGGGGGGGGAAAIVTNVALSAGASISIQIGTGGGSTGSGTAPTANTWFKDASTLVAAGGGAGSQGPGTASGAGGAGGTVANSVGAGGRFAGGNGGGGVVYQQAGGGGGGAAGTTGAGNNGDGGTPYTGGVGGSGDNGTGGGGGSAGSGTGGTGTEIGGGAGSGGGGGGGAPNTVGGLPGNYGAGAGGNGNTLTAANTGAQGVIIITYSSLWPVVTTEDNLPTTQRAQIMRQLAAQNAAAQMAMIFVPQPGLPPPGPLNSWFRPLDEPVRRKSDHAAQAAEARYPGVEAPYVYVPHPLPPPEPAIFDFPIPYFTTDIPSQHITDALNFLIDEVNAALVGQGMTCGDTGSALVHDVVTALNNAGQWLTVWNYMQADHALTDFDIIFSAAFTTRINDPFYQMIQTATGKSTAQMLALWKTANS